MMAAIRHLWNVAVPAPESGALPSEESFLRTSVELARDQLRQALAERDRAQLVLADAIAATERVHQLIGAVETANAANKSASDAAAAATRVWAESGADPNTFAGNQSLLDRATAAERAAHQARLQAEGAKAALPRVRDAENDARLTAEQARDRIRTAVAEVLFSLVEPKLEQLEAARIAYNEALAPIRGLHEILRSVWGNAHPYAQVVRSGGQFAELERLMKEAEIGPRPEALRQETQQWFELAKRLAVDPDAT